MQPGMHPQGAAMPHAMPHCVRCNGTRWNPHLNCRCDYCVCYKCGGSGWDAHKNKPCKKIEIKMSGHVGKAGKKYKKFKKFKGGYKGYKGGKKFKAKKFF